jgi:hypothetical protein
MTEREFVLSLLQLTVEALREQGALVACLTKLLVRKNVITAGDLDEIIKELKAKMAVEAALNPKLQKLEQVFEQLKQRR